MHFFPRENVSTAARHQVSTYLLENVGIWFVLFTALTRARASGHKRGEIG